MSSFTCPITSTSVSESDLINDPGFRGTIYKTRYGILRVTDIAWLMLENFCKNRHDRDILRGHIRNNNFNENDTYEIRSETLTKISKPENLDSFEDQWIHLLKYIEKKCGKRRTPFRLDPKSDYVITYSDNSLEFEQLGAYLYDNSYIDVSNPGSQFPTIMMNVVITDDGMEFLHSGYKLTILSRLANNIFISNPEVNAKVEHAFELFNKYESNREDKRSACKTLADILEPIREEMKKKFFFKKDVEAFFDIVNNFDIRHNNTKTMKLEYDEQFEWVFYSLLNTIISYYKMDSRYKK